MPKEPKVSPHRGKGTRSHRHREAKRSEPEAGLLTGLQLQGAQEGGLLRPALWKALRQQWERARKSPRVRT